MRTKYRYPYAVDAWETLIPRESQHLKSYVAIWTRRCTIYNVKLRGYDPTVPNGIIIKDPHMMMPWHHPLAKIKVSKFKRDIDNMHYQCVRFWKDEYGKDSIEWCEDNCTKDFSMDRGKFFFESRDDSIVFKLWVT